MFFRSHKKSKKVAIGDSFRIGGLEEFLDFLAAFDWKGVKRVKIQTDVYADLPIVWFDVDIATKPLTTRKK